MWLAILKAYWRPLAALAVLLTYTWLIWDSGREHERQHYEAMLTAQEAAHQVEIARAEQRARDASEASRSAYESRIAELQKTVADRPATVIRVCERAPEVPVTTQAASGPTETSNRPLQPAATENTGTVLDTGKLYAITDEADRDWSQCEALKEWARVAL